MKTIVITGSTRGIRLAMAREFLKSGCSVTLSGRAANPPETIVSELAPFEDSYAYFPCDVRRREDLQALWDRSHARWGRIDIWINNAGQNVPHLPVWETAESYTRNVIETNLLGMIAGCQIAAAGMLAQGSGAIYSMEGLGSNNMIQVKTILYGTTKHALSYFMKGLAKELEGTGILAGRLSPGMMLTDFITRSPDGGPSEVISDARFARIFNILGDRPETVAAFFIPRILANRRNDAQIAWLTRRKAAWRFMTARSRQGRLLDV